ncbi:hypothetical protein MTR_1g057190 [Medicago truncatula]|uniref:Uncharacterized protein n=1 Tax=Medicago truncatula TaxID=3880 RepID=A0A072VIS4_MEDTR|nr:hypothetical protein MTR_1g057190 [Medicago truncatula]
MRDPRHFHVLLYGDHGDIDFQEMDDFDAFDVCWVVKCTCVDDCPLHPSSTEWKLHKSKETSSWEFDILEFFFKDDCPLHPSSTEWKLHNNKETSSWEFDFLDQQTWFRDLMNIEKGDKPPPQKKRVKSIQSNFM